MLAAKLAGIGRIVRTDHNPPISNPSRGEKASLWFRDRLLSKLILISEQDRRLYQEKLHRDARKMVVIPHGIDPESFQRPDPVALRESLGIKPDETVIGNIANLGELKGTSMFIEMARILHSSNPGLRFLIVGGGEGLERFRARAAEAGLGDRIIFTGHVPKASVPDYFALLDVFVLASLVESGPYTLLEAMASGLPLVATKVGFVSQVVQPELTGLVVAPGDPAALAAGVTRLLTDTIAAERMGREARKSIAEHYSTDTMVDRIAQVYESVGVVA